MVGNVQTVKLLVNGYVAGTYENPPQTKSGGVNFTVDLSQLPEGSVTLQAIAFQGNDKAGLQGSSSPVIITIDRTPPTLAITPGHGTVLNTATPLIQLTYSDTSVCGIQTGSLQVQINGTDQTTLFTATITGAQAQLATSTALLPGQNTITAKISDKAGNQASASATLTVQTLPPALVRPPDGVPLEYDFPPPHSIPATPDYTLPLYAQVLDALGNGVPNVQVKFRIASGDGTIGSLETIKLTGTSGLATAFYHPGSQEGITEIEVTLPGSPAIPSYTYRVYTVYHVTPGIEKISGDGQITVVGRCLPQPLIIKAVDKNHNNAPLPGSEVRFEVLSGNAVLVKPSNMDKFADSNGLAGVQVILTGAGSAVIQASLWNNLEDKVTFTVSGKMPKIKMVQRK